ncbi:uncharacterized protein MONOS_8102 [Monocercomonoides exilis]|uniref:uncharacterized protein n=1 Tax=Monocercomonoides exilis TaxID=2049356 RepID=UPI00355A4701|nr:hypothetical protein MONOS_8102 [Monocercomonoides exilis]|eukprot:MONOS_8102.1-p1 / transcript=MONOS_8102.1 / gene=MONOS_8102 / organism=Monocercomonoides_exilis_PA203 / gene_product=unspecified product / transcript_product=unspecified product / location=Mono_scaffold00296:28173-29368(-) / protein_length=260 / sequence_SO=supercontig / SO=protein_coding / is_pseudo=false
MAEDRKFPRKEREAHRAERKAREREKKKMEFAMDIDNTLAKEAQMIVMTESPLLVRILMQLSAPRSSSYSKCQGFSHSSGGANAHSSLDYSTSFGMSYLLFPPTGPLPISKQIPSNRYNRHLQGSSSQSVSVGNVVPLGASSASSVSSASVAEQIPSVMPIAGVAGNPSLTDFTILLTQMKQAFLPPPYPLQIEPFFSPSELFHNVNHSSRSTSSAFHPIPQRPLLLHNHHIPPHHHLIHQMKAFFFRVLRKRLIQLEI